MSESLNKSGHRFVQSRPRESEEQGKIGPGVGRSEIRPSYQGLSNPCKDVMYSL